MRTLYVAGDAGVFGPLLEGLDVPTVTYRGIGDPFPEADTCPGGEICWAGRIAEELALARAEELESMRQPLGSDSFHAGIRHVVTCGNRIIRTPPGPELLREARGRRCVVASAFAIRPVEELSLPLLSASVVIELSLEMRPIADAVLSDMERTWRSRQAWHPEDGPAFLLSYARRARLIREDGTVGRNADLGKLIGWKRDELRGLLDIAGLLVPDEP